MHNKSPKYKQRLSALYRHTENAQNKRANIFRGADNKNALNRAVALSSAEDTYNTHLKFALGSTPGEQNFLSKYIASNRASLKNPSFTNEELSGKYNPDEAVRNWYIDYINSPKYKERLRKAGYNNPNQVISDRRNRIQNTKILPQTDHEIGSAYDSNKNELFMDNQQVRKLRTTRDDILTHELGHINNSSTKSTLTRPDYNIIESPSNTSLSKGEEEYIGTRNRKVGFAKMLNAQQAGRERNKTASHILSDIDHDYSPYENKSDLDAFRYILKKEGLYDAGEQDFTPELLEKAKTNKNIKKSFNTQRLFKYFSDDDVVDLMNKIAMNKKSKSNLA